VSDNKQSDSEKVIEAEIVKEEEPKGLTAKKPITVTRMHRIRAWILGISMFAVFLSLLTYFISAIGYRTGVFDLGTSFGLLNREIGPKLLMLGLATGVVSILLAWFIKPRKAVILSIVTALLPFYGLIKLNSVRAEVDRLPLIHDITTDTQNPPVFSDVMVKIREDAAASNPLEYKGKKSKMNRADKDLTLVSVLQTKAYPDIRPVLRSEDPDVVFGIAKDLVRRQGWKIVSEDVDAGIIEATETTFWYGFKDDVVLRIRPAEGGGTIVDIRSVSRVGLSDIGANAERIRVLIKGLSPE